MRITLRLLLSGLVLVAACTDGPLAPEPGEPLVVETVTLAEAIEGHAYSQQLEAAGGSGGYSWTLAAGSLPSGLTLSATGLISGRPVGAGTSSFRAHAVDSGGRSATADLSIRVVQALAVHTGTLPDAEAGKDFSAQLQAVGGRGTLTWSLMGEAPAWLTVSSTGLLSGTPPSPGSAMVAIAVADESGQQATRPLPVTIRDPLAIPAITLPKATQGRAYAAQLVATGGDGAYAWAIDAGALPAGVALGSGGALTGAATVGGDFDFTVRVTDGSGRVATRSLSIHVERAPAIQTVSLPAGDVGTAYTAQLQAIGGTGAYTWSLTAGSLPDGLTLAPSGAISGVPTTLGGSNFTVRVVDEAGAADSRALSIVVAQVQELSSGVAVQAITGDAASVRYYVIQVSAGATQLTVSASGGTGDVDLYVRRGGLPQEYVYDCRPFRPGNDETCTFVAPVSGPWYIMLRGYAAYADVSLVARVDK
jgi:large repetitive protein